MAYTELVRLLQIWLAWSLAFFFCIAAPAQAMSASKALANPLATKLDTHYFPINNTDPDGLDHESEKKRLIYTIGTTAPYAIRTFGVRGLIGVFAGPAAVEAAPFAAGVTGIYVTGRLLFPPGSQPRPMNLELPRPGIKVTLSPRLTNSQMDQIVQLREGRSVEVQTVSQARSLLDAMQDLRPFVGPLSERHSRRPQRPGTYRADLRNLNNQDADSQVHESGNPAHMNNAHYNIIFPGGTKSAIIIKP